MPRRVHPRLVELTTGAPTVCSPSCFKGTVRAACAFVFGSAFEWPAHEKGIWHCAARSVRREVAMAHAILRVSTFAFGVAAFISLSPLSIVWADEATTSGAGSSPDASPPAASGTTAEPSGAASAPNATTPAAIGVTESAPDAAAPAASGATAPTSGTTSPPEAAAPAASGARLAPSVTESRPRGATAAPSETESRHGAAASAASGTTTAASGVTAVQHRAHASVRYYSNHDTRYAHHYRSAHSHNPVAALVAGVFGGVADLGSLAAYPVYCFPRYGSCRVLFPY
jgi:hypothetical protein